MLILLERTKKGWVKNTIYNPKKGIMLNLGCGKEILPNYINGDIIKSPGVELLLDLDSPLPFKSNSVIEVRLSGVIGHLKHPLKLRKELDRVLKDGGMAIIGACECDTHRYNVGGVYFKSSTRARE